MNEINDCRGIQIREGDTVVYPGRRGSSLWLNTGVAIAPRFGEHQKSLNVRKPNGKIVEIFETSRVAVVASAQ